MGRKLFIANTNDDLAEGMFDQDGTLLGLWSPNDGYWSAEFNSFMLRLGHEIESAPDWVVDKLREATMDAWGLTAEEAGIE